MNTLKAQSFDITAVSCAEVKEVLEQSLKQVAYAALEMKRRHKAVACLRFFAAITGVTSAFLKEMPVEEMERALETMLENPQNFPERHIPSAVEFFRKHRTVCVSNN